MKRRRTETGITNKGRCTRTRYKGISLSPVSLLFYQLPRRDQSGQKDNAISLCCANISLYSRPYCATGVPISWKESKLGEAIGSPRITTLFKKFPHTYTYILARKIHSFNNVDVSITLFPMSPLIIYHLTGITHRAVIAREREREGRESFVWDFVERKQGKIFRVGCGGEKKYVTIAKDIRSRESISLIPLRQR